MKIIHNFGIGCKTNFFDRLPISLFRVTYIKFDDTNNPCFQKEIQDFEKYLNALSTNLQEGAATFVRLKIRDKLNMADKVEEMLRKEEDAVNDKVN